MFSCSRNILWAASCGDSKRSRCDEGSIQPPFTFSILDWSSAARWSHAAVVFTLPMTIWCGFPRCERITNAERQSPPSGTSLARGGTFVLLNAANLLVVAICSCPFVFGVKRLCRWIPLEIVEHPHQGYPYREARIRG